MKHGTLVLLLGLAGGTLLLLTYSFFWNDYVRNSPFLVMSGVTLLALRRFGNSETQQERFWAILGVGTLMMVILYLGNVLILVRPRWGLFDHAWRIVFLFACCLVGSMVVAAIDGRLRRVATQG
jgi:hypothetical protein